jgi:hypothetical protein
MENFFRNGYKSDVCISERRPPVLGNPTASTIMNNIHSVAELRDDDLIGEDGHVRVISCLDGDVVASVKIFYNPNSSSPPLFYCRKLTS